MELFISKALYLKRFLGFKKLLTLLIIFFCILTFFAKIYPYFSFDLAITKYIQQFKSPNLDLLMMGISTLGNNTVAFFMIIIAGGYFYTLNKRKESFMIFTSGFGIYALGIFFKTFVARPRPDSNLIIQMVREVKPDSFPSGHVLQFIGLYGFLIFLIYTKFRKNLLQKILVGLFSVMILAIGVSRIYLGAHWFSDVLGSYLLGSIWLLIMVYLYHKLL